MGMQFPFEQGMYSSAAKKAKVMSCSHWLALSGEPEIASTTLGLFPSVASPVMTEVSDLGFLIFK